MLEGVKIAENGRGVVIESARGVIESARGCKLGKMAGVIESGKGSLKVVKGSKHGKMVGGLRKVVRGK